MLFLETGDGHIGALSIIRIEPMQQRKEYKSHRVHYRDGDGTQITVAHADDVEAFLAQQIKRIN